MMLRGGIALGLLSICLLVAGCGGGGKAEKSITAQIDDAGKLSDPVQRSRRFLAIAEKQSKAGDLAGARSTLNGAKDSAVSIADPVSKANTLVLVAAAYGRAGEKGQAGKLADEAAAAIEQIAEPESKVGPLAQLAATTGEHVQNEALAAEYLAAAQQAAESIDDPVRKTAANMRIAAALGKLKQLDESEKLIASTQEAARSLEDARQKADSLTEVAAGLSRMDNMFDESIAAISEAQQAAGQIESDDSRAYALLRIAKTVRTFNKPGAKEVLLEAQDFALKVKDSSVRKPLLSEIENELKKI